ncbi:hypothetical protein ACFLS8_04655 [Chloroflexota bacterium]
MPDEVDDNHHQQRQRQAVVDINLGVPRQRPEGGCRAPAAVGQGEPEDKAGHSHEQGQDKQNGCHNIISGCFSHVPSPGALLCRYYNTGYLRCSTLRLMVAVARLLPVIRPPGLPSGCRRP